MNKFKLSLCFIIVVGVLMIPTTIFCASVSDEFMKEYNEITSIDYQRDFLYLYKVEVLRVIDGDTIVLKVDQGFGHFFIDKFRLFGINTFEKFGSEKELGLKGKKYLESLILDKEILIKSIKDKKGKFGRPLCVLYLNDKNLNTVMGTLHGKFQDY